MVIPISRPPRPLPPTIDPRLPGVIYKDLAPHITLPKNLGRAPRVEDLIITKGFDGLTPRQAVNKIRGALSNALASENRKLVDETAERAYQAFNGSLNNLFTPNTPHSRFVAQFTGRQITMLGSMSVQPVIYKVEGKGIEPTRHYALEGARFSEVTRLPPNVVMEAKIRMSPPGIAMRYPAWTNKALALKELTTIVEM